MDRSLSAVKHAARKRVSAEAVYRDSIRAARETGHTLEAIGQAAGITKNGVRYLLITDPRKEQT